MRPHRMILTATLVALIAPITTSGGAQSIVDGKVRVESLSDDFEDPAWNYNYGTQQSANGKWTQSFRGAPETLNRVATPAGGISGSTAALQVRSVDQDGDGYPGQEDFLTQDYAAGAGAYPVRADMPVVSTRVYLPDISELTTDWFVAGFRTEARSADRIGGGNPVGYYYPSIWINYFPQVGNPATQAGPYFAVRLGDGFTSDTTNILGGPFLSSTGWWTLGVGFDEQGVATYYASPGVDDLTAADKIFDSTMFATSHPTGVNPLMDSLAYSFYSIGYPEGPTNSMKLIVDDFAVHVLPEPTAAAALIIGAAGLLGRRRRGS